MIHGVLGGLVIGGIYNGMFLLGLDVEWEFIVTGLVLIVSVAINSLSRRGSGVGVRAGRARAAPSCERLPGAGGSDDHRGLQLGSIASWSVKPPPQGTMRAAPSHLPIAGFHEDMAAGASQSEGLPASRRTTSSPSSPPSSDARGSWSRASRGSMAMSTVGT